MKEKTKTAKGTMVVISGASGAGKNTLIKMLRDIYTMLIFSVSTTTRKPREGEVNGEHYHFVDIETFQGMISTGKFLEWANVHGNFYGTTFGAVEKIFDSGGAVIMDVDVDGASQILKSAWIKEREVSVLSIFVSVSDTDTLRRRLIKRDGVRGNIDERISNAASEIEIGQSLCELVVCNDDDQLFRCFGEICKYLEDSGVCASIPVCG